MENTIIDEKYLSVWNKFVEDKNASIDTLSASHQPVLITLLKKLDMPRVLELGCGYGSSPLIVDLSSYSEHYETNSEWLEKVKEFESENHTFHLVKDHEKLHWNDPEIFSKTWDVAFVDGASGESRQSNLMKLKDKCRFIVCHDTEEVYTKSESDYKWDFSSFKYHFVFNNYKVFTTVVSNVEPFEM